MSEYVSRCSGCTGAARRRGALAQPPPPRRRPLNYRLLAAGHLTLLLIHYPCWLLATLPYWLSTPSHYSSQVLEVHCARTNGATDLVEAAEASWPNLDEAHACVARLLGASMLSPEAFAEFLPLWKMTNASVAPPTALAGAAAHLSDTIFSQSQAPDASSERAVLALVPQTLSEPSPALAR